jgi:hypothetical protein
MNNGGLALIKQGNGFGSYNLNRIKTFALSPAARIPFNFDRSQQFNESINSFYTLRLT